MEWVIKTVSNKSPELDGFTGKYHKIFLKTVNLSQTIFQKIEKEEMLLNSFYKTSIILTLKKKDRHLRRNK